MHTIVNNNNKIYYAGQYWNDYPAVQEYINLNFTGNKHKTWQQDFKERYAKKPFKHGLFLNCGNGWVEREFIDMKITKQAIAFDYSQELLNDAINKKGDRNINYFKADVNKIKFEKNQFDLVVNVAALHHVQYLNRLYYLLSNSLTKKGIFVSFDYIGPHRNQYSLKQWYYVNKANRSLQTFIKKNPLDYPHLPAMLYSDPTEAIHSELIFKILPRYFHLIERHDTGGGIAYILLTHNSKMNQLLPLRLDQYLSEALRIDKKATSQKETPSMFSYFIAQPNKDTLKNKRLINYYQRDENFRENKAENFGNIYYPSEYLKFLKSKHHHPLIMLSYLIKLPLFLFLCLNQWTSKNIDFLLMRISAKKIF